jgi:HlyD family secretion protein
MNRGFFVWLGAGVIAVGAVAWYGWQHRDPSQVHVQTAQVTSGAVARRVVVSGTLQAVKSVDVGSQLSGSIKSLQADFNSIVKKGDIVAHLDPVPFQDALDNAQAAYARAQADLEGYKVEVEDTGEKLTRAKSLRARDLITQQDLDSAQIAYDTAKADVEVGSAQVTAAKGQVDQAQTNLDHATITSPVDGIVVNRAVDVGQTVAASYQAPVLFTVAANIDQMQVQAQVDEADLAAVQEGQDVSFVVESYPDSTFYGRVSLVRLQPTSATGAGNVTNPNGQSVTSAANGVTYTTIIDVDNSDHRLRPGMTATAVLIGASHDNAIRIPNTAILFRPSLDLLKAVGQGDLSTARTQSAGDEELDQVWTYDGKRFTPVGVRIGLSDAQWVEEVSGPLKPGDSVVTMASYGKTPPPPVKR